MWVPGKIYPMWDAKSLLFLVSWLLKWMVGISYRIPGITQNILGEDIYILCIYKFISPLMANLRYGNLFSALGRSSRLLGWGRGKSGGGPNGERISKYSFWNGKSEVSVSKIRGEQALLDGNMQLLSMRDFHYIWSDICIFPRWVSENVSPLQQPCFFHWNIHCHIERKVLVDLSEPWLLGLSWGLRIPLQGGHLSFTTRQKLIHVLAWHLAHAVIQLQGPIWTVWKHISVYIIGWCIGELRRFNHAGWSQVKPLK